MPSAADHLEGAFERLTQKDIEDLSPARRARLKALGAQMVVRCDEYVVQQAKAKRRKRSP
jgi:hypothetical protein